MPAASGIIRQAADPVQVQLSFCPPAPHAFRDTGPEMLVKRKSPDRQLLWRKGAGQLFHGPANRLERLSELALEISLHSGGLDATGFLDGSYPARGLCRRDGPPKKLDPEFLSPPGL